MSLVEMQSCLAKLYTDLAFQQLFFLDPFLCLKEYSLTSDETHALTTLNRTRLYRFTLSLMNKSRESFEKDYPLLFKVAGPQIEGTFPGFYHLTWGQTHEPDQQLLEFGAFMAQSFKAAPQLPVYYSELARYERQLLNTGLKADYQRHLSEADEASPLLSFASRISLAAGATCEEYSHNIVELVQLIRQDLPVIQPETGSFIFLVYPAPLKIRPQTLELNPATRKLLELCDGELTVREIIGKLEPLLGKSDLEAIIMENLAELVGMGVLDARLC